MLHIKMKRSKAISEASDFLGTKYDLKTGGTAKKIKEKGKKNDLNRIQLNQIVADVFQRGAKPKDIDLRKIDFTTSYDNIRRQVKDLVKKNKGESAVFRSEKKEKKERLSAKAKKQMADRNRTLAETIHERRPDLNQYVDETRTAERTFNQPTDQQFDTWKRNPAKYDIKGVDARKEPAARQQVKLPFQKENSEKMPDDIPLSGGTGLMRYQYRKKKKAKNVAERLGLSGVHKHEKNGNTIYMPGTNHKKLNRALKRENMPPAMKPGQGSAMNMGGKTKLTPGTQDLTTGRSNATKLLSGGKNLTAMKDTEKKATKRRSSMDARTEQQGLRSGGFVSMENEKTIDKYTSGESNASKMAKGEVNYF